MHYFALHALPLSYAIVCLTRLECPHLELQSSQGRPSSTGAPRILAKPLPFSPGKLRVASSPARSQGPTNCYAGALGTDEEDELASQVVLCCCVQRRGCSAGDVADHLQYLSTDCEMQSSCFHSLQINSMATEEMKALNAVRGIEIPETPCTFHGNSLHVSRGPRTREVPHCWISSVVSLMFLFPAVQSKLKMLMAAGRYIDPGLYDEIRRIEAGMKYLLSCAHLRNGALSLYCLDAYNERRIFTKASPDSILMAPAINVKTYGF